MNYRTLLLFLCFFILMINQNFGQKLKGKVKSYRDIYYSVHEDFGITKKSSRLNDPAFHDQYVTLDENGNVSEMIEYNFDGTIYCKYKGRCDYADNNVDTTHVRFYSEIAINKKSFILESANYSLGKMCEMTYKNDTMGHPIEETISDLMGRELYKILIKRDEKGNTVEEQLSN